jgi:DNA polymerase-3 subunit epsilon
LVFLDTETTGLSADDRVIELYLTHAGQSFYSRFDPEGRLSSPQAFEVHRIPDADLIGEPYFKDKVDELIDHLEGAALVAHNAPFDVRFLRQEFALAGVEWTPCAVIDTKKVAKRLLSNLPSHRLSHLADYFEIPHLSDHTAAGDVVTLQRVWEQLCSRLPPSTTLKDLI